MNRNPASAILVSVAVLAASFCRAQSWQPSFDGYATGVAASTGDGLLDQVSGYPYSASEVDFAHGGSPSSKFDGYTGVGYSDVRFALVQDESGRYERHDPVTGAFVGVHDPLGGIARTARMDPVSGAVTFQTDNGYYRLGADDSIVSLPPPPVAIYEWSAPDASGSFVGSDGKYSYLYSGGTWSQILYPNDWRTSIVLTGMNLSGGVEYMDGYAEDFSGNEWELGMKRDGAGWDYFDLGLTLGTYSAPDDQGRVMFVTGGYSELLTIGQAGGTVIENPADMVYGQIGQVLASDGLFVTNFLDGNFQAHAYTFSPAAVPEPASATYLAVGGAFLTARRRRSAQGKRRSGTP